MALPDTSRTRRNTTPMEQPTITTATAVDFAVLLAREIQDLSDSVFKFIYPRKTYSDIGGSPRSTSNSISGDDSKGDRRVSEFYTLIQLGLRLTVPQGVFCSLCWKRGHSEKGPFADALYNPQLLVGILYHTNIDPNKRIAIGNGHFHFDSHFGISAHHELIMCGWVPSIRL